MLCLCCRFQGVFVGVLYIIVCSRERYGMRPVRCDVTQQAYSNLVVSSRPSCLCLCSCLWFY
jgi:hypothetical protein